MPGGDGWRHVYGVSWVAGNGLTASLFITNLAFTDPALLNPAKPGVLGASAIAGPIGLLLSRRPGGSRAVGRAGRVTGEVAAD